MRTFHYGYLESFLGLGLCVREMGMMLPAISKALRDYCRYCPWGMVARSEASGGYSFSPPSADSLPFSS